MKPTAHRGRNITHLFMIISLLASPPMVRADDCSVNPATNETSAVDGKNLYVQQGQAFHVNIDAVAITLSPAELADFKAGINSWSGVSGITIAFDASPAGPGVIIVSNDTQVQSTGEGFFNYGGTGANPDQITGGKIELNLGYKADCASGKCLGYDPSAPNADGYLTGLAAHEMGHIMGLKEPLDAQQNPCAQKSTSVMGGQCGTNNNGNGTSPPAPTSNTPTDCDKKNVTVQTSIGPRSSGGAGGPKGGNTVTQDQAPDSGDGGGSCGGEGYEEWDESTSTLTYYSPC